MKGRFRERTQVRSPEASQVSSVVGLETQKETAKRQGCRRETGKAVEDWDLQGAWASLQRPWESHVFHPRRIF